MATIRVLNHHHLQGRIEGTVYIGRAGKGEAGSALANPYHVRPHGPYDRGEALVLYERWLRGQIEARSPGVVSEMNRLYGLARAGKLALRCFCAPQPCHGHVIAKILRERMIAHRRD